MAKSDRSTRSSKITSGPAATTLRVADAPAGRDLPDYIVERNRRALCAGLRIEKQVVKNDRLTTVYRGLPEAFLESGLVEDRDKFMKSASARTKSFNSYACMRVLFSPTDSCRLPQIYRTDGQELRATITRELFPSRIRIHAPGVTAYEHPGTQGGHRLDRRSISYVCERPEPLINLGIAPAQAFEFNDGGYAHEMGNRHQWQVFAKKDWGRFVLRHFPENAERAERERDEKVDRIIAEHVEKHFRCPDSFRHRATGAANGKVRGGTRDCPDPPAEKAKLRHWRFLLLARGRHMSCRGTAKS